MAGDHGTPTTQTTDASPEAHVPSDAFPQTNRLLFLSGSAVSVFILLVTFFAWRMAWHNLYQLAESRLEREVHAIQLQLQDRLDAHTSVLFGLRSVFIAAETVEQNDWKELVRNFSLERRYPGIVGTGYIELVPAAEKHAFEERVRNDRSVDMRGSPDFRIHPEGEREEYYVLKYLEPHGDGKHVLGLDAGTFTSAILNRIRDSGELRSIGRVDFGYGASDYVFLLPVYQSDLPQQTVYERRAAFTGFVVVAVRPHLILEGVEPVSEGESAQFVMEFFDERGALFYRRAFPSHFLLESGNGLTTEIPLETAGLQWTLHVTALREFGLDAPTLRGPRYVLLGGTGFALLFCVVLYLVASSRLRALHLAGRMTSELGKFKLAVKHASNNIIITDPEGVILYANASVQNITGYSSQEIIGNTPRLWGGQMDKEFYDVMWRIMKEERQSYNGELVNRRKDGTCYDALVHISPILDKQGNLFGFVGIEEDITPRKRLEKSRSEFVSLASHQLRTPLTAMRLTLETLLGGAAGTLDDNQRQMLLRSQEYAIHMSETIYTMLTVSHLEAGKLSVTRAPVDLHKLFAELQREYEPEFARRQQRVSCVCPEGLTIQSDQRLLREVLANLVSNATKYTPEGGEITVSAVQQDGEVRIDVTDTGYGIPHTQHDRVFQKFFRGDNIMKKNTEGTGLGLYLVHSLITLLGGRIAFVSEENDGTTFSLFLPFSPPSHE